METRHKFLILFLIICVILIVMIIRKDIRVNPDSPPSPPHLSDEDEDEDGDEDENEDDDIPDYEDSDDQGGMRDIAHNWKCYNDRYYDLHKVYDGDEVKLKRHWEKHGKREGRTTKCNDISYGIINPNRAIEHWTTVNSYDECRRHAIRKGGPCFIVQTRYHPDIKGKNKLGCGVYTSLDHYKKLDHTTIDSAHIVGCANHIASIKNKCKLKIKGETTTNKINLRDP